MPKAVFKLLWETISSGQEIFAYVLNRSSRGNEYWVLAHVTPSRNNDGQIVGYHSNRRIPNRKVLEGTIQPLYKKLLEIEKNAGSKRDGLEQSYSALMDIVNSSGKSYNHFIMTLGE